MGGGGRGERGGWWGDVHDATSNTGIMVHVPSASQISRTFLSLAKTGAMESCRERVLGNVAPTHTWAGDGGKLTVLDSPA